MNRYLRAAISGARPTVDEWQSHLIEFHERFPDATTLPMSLLRTDGGLRSYEHVARRLAAIAPGAVSILDVGCGDGTFLLALRDAFGAHAHLSGIDLVPGEIARALHTVPDASLREGDIANAHYPPASFDLVTGHLSFPLIPGLCAVLTSIRAMLSDGGRLAFANEDPLSDSWIFRALSAAMAPVRKRFPAFAPAVPSRESIEDDALLDVLLREAGFTNVPHTERYTIRGSLTPDLVWEIGRRAYPFGLLPIDAQEEAASALRAFVGEAAIDGVADVRMTLRLTVVER